LFIHSWAAARACERPPPAAAKPARARESVAGAKRRRLTRLGRCEVRGCAGRDSKGQSRGGQRRRKHHRSERSERRGAQRASVRLATGASVVAVVARTVAYNRTAVASVEIATDLVGIDTLARPGEQRDLTQPDPYKCRNDTCDQRRGVHKYTLRFGRRRDGWQNLINKTDSG